MLTVGEVWNAARDEHPALSDVNAPLGLAFRRLTRLENDLFDAIYKRVPGFLAKSVVVTLPLPDFGAGIDLGALITAGWKDLTDLMFRYINVPTLPNTVRGVFVPWEQRDMRRQQPSYTFRDNFLFLFGNDTDYTAYADMTLTYTPMNAALVDESSTFLLPDDARDSLALKLAAFYLRRLIGNPQFGVTRENWLAVQEDADRAQIQFLTRIFTLTQRQDYRVREVR